MGTKKKVALLLLFGLGSLWVFLLIFALFVLEVDVVSRVLTFNLGDDEMRLTLDIVPVSPVW